MTGSLHLVAAGSLIVLGLSAPALARASDKASARGASDAAASCIARREPAFSSAWMNTLPASPEETALVQSRRKGLDACLRKSGLAMDGAMQPELKQAVAGQLLARDFPHLPATAPFPRGTAPWFAVKLLTAPDAKFDRAQLRTANFANCVALSQWSETTALLSAEAGSTGARDAAAALRPSLSSCLTHSVTVKFEIVSLRLMLADAVFHIMSTARLSGAAPAKP